MLLARAGVGKLTLIDRDIVEMSNLHRQLLFDENDAKVGEAKAVAAARRLQQINSEIQIKSAVADVTATNVKSLIGDAEIIYDGLDNFQTRYLLNDLAVHTAKPFIYGGAVGDQMTQAVILPCTMDVDATHHTPCLRCLGSMPSAGSEPTCQSQGVLGPAVTTVASIQAAETMKLIIDGPSAVRRTMIRGQFWPWRITEVPWNHDAMDPQCPCCVGGQFEHLNSDTPRIAAQLCGRDAVQIHLPPDQAITLETWQQRFDPATAQVTCVDHRTQLSRIHLTDQGRPLQISLFADGRVIVHGTSDIAQARSVYSRYIGC